MSRAEWEAQNWHAITTSQLGALTKVGAHVEIVAEHHADLPVKFVVFTAGDPCVEIDVFSTHREAMEFCRDMKFVVEMEVKNG
jgi:hypothetical protein